jgi:hypothetical protein
MKKIKNSLILLILLYLFTFIPGTYAQEAEDSNLGIIIDPAIIIIDVDPGEIYTDSINLTHDFETDEAVTFYPSARPFTQSGETGSPEYIFDENLPDIVNTASWVEFEEEEYTLNQGETDASNFTITVPENVDPGGYYVALIFGDNPQSSGEAVSVSKNIVSLVFMTVRGEAEQDGNIVEFSTDKNLYEFLPVNFTVRYENTGSVHQLPGGNIFIHRGDLSNPVASIVFNEDQSLSLPDATRAYGESYTDGFLYFEDGKLKLDQSKFPKMYFGEYTATLKFKHTVNGERITVEKETSFWVIPWKLIGGVILLIVAIILIIRRIRKGKKKDQYTASARRFK